MHSSKQRIPQKTGVLLVSLILLVALAAVGSYAFLADRTQPVVNTFIPATMTPEVDEETDGGIKENVMITNKGDMDAYVRAKILVNWVDDKGNLVAAKPPVAGTDYSLTFGSGKWTFDSDSGYYYYNGIVKPGKATEVLLIKGEASTETEPPEGYYLSITILAQTIETRSGAVAEAWGNEAAVLVGATGGGAG